MGRNKALMPSYRLHKASGRALVTLDGKDVYLGPYGSIESRLKYNHVVAEFTMIGEVPKKETIETPETTVNDVIAAFWLHAESYYVKNSKAKSEMHAVRTILRPLRELFGSEPAKDFGPAKLKEVRRRWINPRPFSRSFVGWVVSADDRKAVGLAFDSVNVEMKMRRLSSRHRPNEMRRGDSGRVLGRRGPTTADAIR